MARVRKSHWYTNSVQGQPKDRPLRILQLVSSSATSGAEHHTVSLAELLKCEGHSVEVVCPDIAWMHESLSSAGIKSYPVDFKSGGGIAGLKSILRVATSGNFDIIHTHLSRATYVGALASMRAKVPLITSVHVETKEPIYKWIGRGRNRLIAVSHYIESVLLKQGARVESIDVVYNGTNFGDAPPHSRLDVCNELKIDPRSRIIGLIGRVAPEKGHHIALRALNSVLADDPNVHLLFVGRTEGDFHSQLVAEAKKLGIQNKITFTGNRTDVSRLIDAMEFTVLPTVMESFGLAVIECMSRGKPVIASSVGALNELVDHGKTGFLVPQTVCDFSKAMTDLLSDSTLCEEMGRCAKVVAHERFSYEKMINRMLDVYFKTLNISKKT